PVVGPDPGGGRSVDVDRRAHLDHLVQLGDVLVAHADAAVAHGPADRVFVVDVGAVDHVAVAEVGLVGAEGVGHAALGTVQRGGEALVVEDDLHPWGERPEVPELVDAADLVAANLDVGAVKEANALTALEFNDFQTPPNNLLVVIPVGWPPDRVGLLGEDLALAAGRGEPVRLACIGERLAAADGDRRGEERVVAGQQPQAPGLDGDDDPPALGCEGGAPDWAAG